MRILVKLLAAATLGFASMAACAGAPPASDAHTAWTQDADELAKRGTADNAGRPADDRGPRCPYGELIDAHRGFVRCLLPDERDAGWLPPQAPGDTPPPPKAEPPKAEPPKAEPPKAEPPPIAELPKPAPSVEIGTPRFENGQVTKVEKSLGKAAAKLAACVAEHGGLTGEGGSMKVQFLVRSRGRAEGVEVLAAKGVSTEAASCVRLLLRNKAIGAPSADPVGVTVTIAFKPAP